MLLYNLIVENKELLKIFYALVIAMICAFIVIKTNRLFKISSHQGIRYLRNAFFFYGIAFIIRYFLGVLSFQGDLGQIYNFLIQIFFESFIIMAGFFLLYSLLQKKIESEVNFNSLFNQKVILFYGIAFVIAIIDFLWKTSYLMFISQIMLFAYASIIGFINYKKNGRKHKFLKFYFMAMLLSFTAWILNALAAVYFNWDKGIMMSIYGINIIFFLLFLYGIVKVTRVK
jgi:hypothetical protein